MIRNRVESCFQLFQDYVESAHEQKVENESLAVSRAREQASRLRLWAANIGVFTNYQASLDYRLRSTPDVAESITEMLDVLSIRIQHVQDPTLCYPQDDTPEKSLVFNSSKNSSSNNLTPGSQDIEQFKSSLEAQRDEEILAVSDAIGRLQRISLAIRKAGTKSSLSRATEFVIRDSIDDGKEYEVDFQSYVEDVLSHRISQAPLSLREQLALYVTLRRRRFLYSREHQRKLQFHSKQPEKTTIPTKSEPTVVNPSVNALREPAKKPVQVPNEEPPHSETNASAFDRKQFIFESTSTVASSQMSFSPITLANPDLPSAPTVTKDAFENECPYCCWLLPARVFSSERRWRQHVEQDLEPYMCFSEDCLHPPKSFATMKHWVAHINEQHSYEWVCPLHRERRGSFSSSSTVTGIGKERARDDSGTSAPVLNEMLDPLAFTFRTKETMENHLKRDHADLSASQTRIIIRRSARLGANRMFQRCPFCSWLPEGASEGKLVDVGHISEMQGHIANHFLSLSLMSLPWRDDVEAEDESDGDQSFALSRQASEGIRSEESGRVSQTSYVSSGTHGSLPSIGKLTSSFPADIESQPTEVVPITIPSKTFQSIHYNTAEGMDHRALEGRGKALGTEHSDTLTSVNNLALVLQGKDEEAEEINHLALEGRVDVNAQGNDYGNALQAASAKGHQAVVDDLLARGADVNAQGGYYGNALQAASARGYQTVVELLLARGADVNAQGGYYGNTLQAASAGGYQTVIELLLAKGADINAQGGYYGNALQAASAGGHKDIVEILLMNGAIIDIEGGAYGTALQAASAGGHKGIVELLLINGAHISIESGD